MDTMSNTICSIPSRQVEVMVAMTIQSHRKSITMAITPSLIPHIRRVTMRWTHTRLLISIITLTTMLIQYSNQNRPTGLTHIHSQNIMSQNIVMNMYSSRRHERQSGGGRQ